MKPCADKCTGTRPVVLILDGTPAICDEKSAIPDKREKARKKWASMIGVRESKRAD